MVRWLVLSNCQTVGLTHSLQLLAPELEVVGIDYWTYRHNVAAHNASLWNYERIIAHPEILMLPEFPLDTPPVTIVPSIYFRAYHPDIAYFVVDEVLMQGPLGPYHSSLAVAAFNAGYRPAEARTLFASAVYERAGYLTSWSGQRDWLMAHFLNSGLDLAPAFRRWSRGEPFMHSLDHPRINAVFDLARCVLQALDQPCAACTILPPDNLVNGPCPALYPEVGEALGVEGAYAFKPSGTFRCLSLSEFLDASFTCFEQYGRGRIQPHPGYEKAYERVEQVVAGSS